MYNSVPQFCNIHIDQELDRFCITCEKKICLKCSFLQTHDRHLMAFRAIMKSALRTDIQAVCKDLAEILEIKTHYLKLKDQIAAASKVHIKHVYTQFTQTSNQTIHQYMEKCDFIRASETELCKQLKEYFLSNSDVLDTNMVEDYINSFQNLLSKTDSEMETKFPHIRVLLDNASDVIASKKRDFSVEQVRFRNYLDEPNGRQPPEDQYCIGYLEAVTEKSEPMVFASISTDESSAI